MSIATKTTEFFPLRDAAAERNPDTTQFERGYRELWFQANKRTPIAELRADVSALVKKANRADLEHGYHMVHSYCAEVLSGQPVHPARYNKVRCPRLRRLLVGALPLALLVTGLAYVESGAAMIGVVLAAFVLFRVLDAQLTNAFHEARFDRSDAFSISVRKLACDLRVPVEKITGALLAEMHKAYVPMLARELRDRDLVEASMIRGGRAGGRRHNHGMVGGGAAYAGASAFMPTDSGPTVNVDGTPMIQGTNLDINNKVFGDI